tara:strand:+ start:10280 stop:10843 length:564 start_codon:yes stop_codon:yes gene_type:complete
MPKEEKELIPKEVSKSSNSEKSSKQTEGNKKVVSQTTKNSDTKKVSLKVEKDKKIIRDASDKTINKNFNSPKLTLIEEFESNQQKKSLPEIYVGDTVRVGVRITEGNKERVQPYEGVVIAKRHGGLNQTITVRRIFQGIGVERIFMLHSPQVASIKVERRGKVRRAKLFYLRDRVGKATRVKQRFDR